MLRGTGELELSLIIFSFIGRRSKEEDWRTILSRMLGKERRRREGGLRTCNPCGFDVEEGPSSWGQEEDLRDPVIIIHTNVRGNEMASRRNEPSCCLL